MSFYRTISILMFTLFCFSTGIASAESKSSKRYGEIGFGYISYNCKGCDASTPLNLKVNVPVQTNLDVYGRFTYLSSEEPFIQNNPFLPQNQVTINTRMTLGAGASYTFKPGEQINPFVSAELDMIMSEMDNPYSTADDNNTGIAISGGLHYDMSDPMAVTPYFEYTSVKSNTDLGLGVECNYWFTYNMGITAGLIHHIDAETNSINLAFDYMF